MIRQLLRPAAALGLLLMAPADAPAYIGPGAGFAFLGSLLGILSALMAGLVALLLIPFRFFVRKSFARGLLILIVLSAGGGLIYRALRPTPPPAAGLKIIILGFDGMDPRLVETLWKEGDLPNLRRLAGAQGLLRLQSTWPPASPVAWSTFATGLDPHEHGVRDFLKFDPADHSLEFSMAKISPAQKTFRVGKWQIPLESPEVSSFRRGTGFWTELVDRQIPAVVLRVPVTFPPERSTRMLSGMGVPDLKGTQGTFAFYTDELSLAPRDAGEAVEVRMRSGGDAFDADIAGPSSPYRRDAAPAQIPIFGRIIQDKRALEILVQDQKVLLKIGEWSPWVSAIFKFGALSYADGLVKFYLKSLSPHLELYQSPIQIDPRAPALPISHPAGYSAELSGRIGLYHTAGMPEETWGLNSGAISDEAFLDQVRQVHSERRKMFEDEFSRLRAGALVCVFDSPDRVSHLFWRTMDPHHPLYDPAAPDTSRLAIRQIYAAMDEIVGFVLDRADSMTRTVVLSDHGFSSFRRAVHLNAFLRDAGFLVLRDPFRKSGGEFFENVEWSRTRAFAGGLNGLYLNIPKNRPGSKPLSDTEISERKISIRRYLLSITDPKSGRRIIRRVMDASPLPDAAGRISASGASSADVSDIGPDLIVGYDDGYRASWQTALGSTPVETLEDNLKKWSGDHLVDPDLVPGILITDMPVIISDPHLRDIAPSILALLGVAHSGRHIFFVP